MQKLVTIQCVLVVENDDLEKMFKSTVGFQAQESLAAAEKESHEL